MNTKEIQDWLASGLPSANFRVLNPIYFSLELDFPQFLDPEETYVLLGSGTMAVGNISTTHNVHGRLVPGETCYLTTYGPRDGGGGESAATYSISLSVSIFRLAELVEQAFDVEEGHVNIPLSDFRGIESIELRIERGNNDDFILKGEICLSDQEKVFVSTYETPSSNPTPEPNKLSDGAIIIDSWLPKEFPEEQVTNYLYAGRYEPISDEAVGQFEGLISNSDNELIIREDTGIGDEAEVNLTGKPAFHVDDLVIPPGKLEIEVSGDSDIVWAHFLGDDAQDYFANKRGEEFDTLDFLQCCSERSALVCHGLNTEGSLRLSVLCNDRLIYTGPLVEVEFDEADSAEAIRAEISEWTEFDFDKVVSHNLASEADRLSAGELHFSDIDGFKYCVLEVVGSVSSVGRISLQLENEFRLSDLRAVVSDVDSGGEGSLINWIYSYTSLETELCGFRIFDDYHELPVGEYSGGWSDWSYLENSDRQWRRSEELELLIDQCNSA